MTGELEVSTTSVTSSVRSMQHTIIKSVALAIPVAIALFIGLVALAVRNQQPDWSAWIAMAAGIGVVAGTFFGLMLGFMLSSDLFAE